VIDLKKSIAVISLYWFTSKHDIYYKNPRNPSRKEILCYYMKLDQNKIVILIPSYNTKQLTSLSVADTKKLLILHVFSMDETAMSTPPKHNQI
jgi:hypothetical protein